MLSSFFCQKKIPHFLWCCKSLPPDGKSTETIRHIRQDDGIPSVPPNYSGEVHSRQIVYVFSVFVKKHFIGWKYLFGGLSAHSLHGKMIYNGSEQM
jgi:hypothetical protein